MQIEHKQQPNDWTCVHTCLSMVTGTPVEELLERFGDHAIGFDEMATVFVEHGIFPEFTTNQHHPFDRCGVYFVAAPSLNLPGKLHQVVVEASEDGYIVHDPQAGREGKRWYRNEDVVSGDLARAEVIYLDTFTLRKMEGRKPLPE